MSLYILLRQPSVYRWPSEGSQAFFSPGQSHLSGREKKKKKSFPLLLFFPVWRAENNRPSPSTPAPLYITDWGGRIFVLSCGGVCVSTHALEVKHRVLGGNKPCLAITWPANCTDFWNSPTVRSPARKYKPVFRRLGDVCLIFKCLLSKW